MSNVESWRDEQLTAIEMLKNDVKKWQAEIKKEAISWRDEILQETNNWKQEIKDEIKMIKGEVKDGYKGTIGEGASSTDILGPSTGESDKAEADDAPRRKRRSSSSGTD
jgi:hypothetical protein